MRKMTDYLIRKIFKCKDSDNGGTDLKTEVLQGLSPARSLVKSLPQMTIMAPLMEGPDPYGSKVGDSKCGCLWQWVKWKLSPSGASNTYKQSNPTLLLRVSAPLAPVHVSTTDPLSHLSIKDTPIETLSAHYILQQYIAASGGQKLLNRIMNAYATGKLKMIASKFETATRVLKNRNSARAAKSGGFVLWQMNPRMWFLELAVGGSLVHAGCDGKLVWRHTPSQTAKGPVRPLRRALQGLDPRTTASIFADARFIGEKKIEGEDCFILELCADPQTLKAGSASPAEIIRHVLFGYFSQKTGLLVQIEDSHLTRNQSNGSGTVYYETTIRSFLDDYRPVEGIMVAHSGCSVVTCFRFGETAMNHTKTSIEETWTIEEVAFNIPGLSVECFIPPADIRSGAIDDAYELTPDEREIVQ